MCKNCLKNINLFKRYNIMTKMLLEKNLLFYGNLTYVRNKNPKGILFINSIDKATSIFIKN